MTFVPDCCNGRCGAATAIPGRGVSGNMEPCTCRNRPVCDHDWHISEFQPVNPRSGYFDQCTKCLAIRQVGAKL